jgi:hypothetical protein
MSDQEKTNPDAGSESKTESGTGLSFDSLADEIEGKDKTNMELFAGLMNLVSKTPANNSVSKVHHDNGDLTVSTQSCSFTQTMRDGGYFRVKTAEGEVVFHLRTDGDIDLVGPDFDDTLRRVNAGSGIFFWTNAQGTIRITYDEQRGFSTSSVDAEKLFQ